MDCGGKLALDAYEAELARRCSSAPPNHDAWQELWNRYSRLALFAIQGKIGKSDPGAADDLVNETYKRLFVTISSYDPSRARLGTFIVTIAKNLAVDYGRREKGRKFREVPLPDKPIGSMIASASQVMNIEEVAKRMCEVMLPPHDDTERQIFEKLMDGLRIQEIVKETGFSEKVVARVRRNTLVQARQILSDMLPDK